MESKDLPYIVDRPATAAATGPLPSAPIEAACMLAAAPRGLRRFERYDLKLSGTETPTIGWWARANWDYSEADAEAGGPWSNECVTHLRQLGLLGSNRKVPEVAEITSAGRKLVKALKLQAGGSANARHGGSASNNEKTANPPVGDSQ